jgi:RND family efflux transporter MFP subunit
MRTVVRILLLLILAGAGAAGVMVWRDRQETAVSAQVPAAPPVRGLELSAAEVAVVRPRELRDVVRFSGSLVPYDQTTVKSRVAGQLAEVTVREGETVVAGQVVARLDLTELNARLAEKQSMLRAAEADADLANKTRANKLQLFERGIAPKTQIDQAEADFAYKRSVVAANAAQVEVARKALADATIKAPMAGIVAERIANPGESIPADGKVLTLVDTSRMEVEALVPSVDVARLRLRQEARIGVDGFGDRRFSGTIARISPMTVAGARSVPVYVAVTEAEPALRGGMFATGEVTVAEKSNALALPPAAVRSDEAGAFALVLRDGTLHRQQVRVVQTWARGDLLEIEGLNPGDRVVVAPLPGLKPGMAVRAPAES